MDVVIDRTPLWGRIPCNGALKQVPQGDVHNPEDWHVRLFGPSGLVDRLSDRLSIWNINLSG